MKNKNITVSLDDIEIDISLDKIIDREVNKRVKEEIKRIKAESEFRIDHGGRREGNTYRTLLYAQLLASDKPDQNIIIVASSWNWAKSIFKDCAELTRHLGIKTNNSRSFIEYPNNSRIHFTAYDRDRVFVKRMAGLNNIQFLFDNSVDWQYSYI